MRTVLRVLMPAALIAALIGLWQIAASAGWIADALHLEPFLVPSPAEVGDALWNSRSLLLENAWVTLREILAGLLAGVIVGIALSVLLGSGLGVFAHYMGSTVGRLTAFLVALYFLQTFAQHVYRAVDGIDVTRELIIVTGLRLSFTIAAVTVLWYLNAHKLRRQPEL